MVSGIMMVADGTSRSHPIGALTFGVISHPLKNGFTASVALKSRI
jgi:hypothetical protein